MTPDNHYVSMEAMGGINAKSSAITGKEMFNLLDLNEGKLDDGDEVIISTPGDKPTYSREGDNQVDRVGQKPDAACKFTVKSQGTSILLKTPGGKFIGDAR